MFAELPVVGSEGGEEVGINVEFADDLAVAKDGNNDFRFGLQRAGKIARVGIHVVNDNGSTARSRGATDSLIQGDAGVGRHGALERAENEDVAVGFPLEHVKTNPIVASELGVKERDDALHESVGRGRCGGEGVQFGNQIGGLGVCGGHGNSRTQVTGLGQMAASRVWQGC